jgi:hypothetical protein
MIYCNDMLHFDHDSPMTGTLLPDAPAGRVCNVGVVEMLKMSKYGQNPANCPKIALRSASYLARDGSAWVTQTGADHSMLPSSWVRRA